jgi:hypothetical protein
VTPVYFTDRDLGKSFPAALRAAGILVEEHAAHFAPNTPDQVWIAEVARRGWTALTHDARIRYKPNGRDAVLQAGLGLIVLVGAAPHADLAGNFIRSVQQVEAFVARTPLPFIARLYRPSPADLRKKPSAPGRIVPWLP